NDESVIGTVAHWSKATVVSLKDIYPKKFLNFSFKVRNYYPDVCMKSGFFHPVDDAYKFKEKVFKELGNALNDLPIKQTLLNTSEDVRNQLLSLFFNEK